MADKKTIDKTYRIPRRRGNGEVREEVWENRQGQVTHYNLSYINHDIYQRDNGRVVGYDNSHGQHHRHFMGRVELIDFTSIEDIKTRFSNDQLALGAARENDRPKG